VFAGRILYALHAVFTRCFIPQGNNEFPKRTLKHKPPVTRSCPILRAPDVRYQPAGSTRPSGSSWPARRARRRAAGARSRIHCVHRSRRSRPTIPGVRRASSPFRAEMHLVSTPAGKRGGCAAVAAHPATLTPLDARAGLCAARGWEVLRPLRALARAPRALAKARARARY